MLLYFLFEHILFKITDLSTIYFKIFNKEYDDSLNGF